MSSLYDIVGQQQAQALGMVEGLPPGAGLSPNESMIARGQIVSGDRVTVGATGTATLTFKVQAPFRPNSLVLTSLGIARGLSNVVVTQIRVGTKDQLIGETNQVPLDVFSPDNLNGKVMMDTAQTAQVIAVTLTNTSSTPEVIAGAMFGFRLDK